jgi:hypothetical protein
VNFKDRLVYAREVQKTTTPAAATQPKTITWRYPFLFGLRFLGRESTLQCQPHARITYPLQSWVETSDDASGRACDLAIRCKDYAFQIESFRQIPTNCANLSQCRAWGRRFPLRISAAYDQDTPSAVAIDEVDTFESRG